MEKEQLEIMIDENLENELSENEKKWTKLQERKKKLHNQKRLNQLKSFLDGQPQRNNLYNNNQMRKKIYFYASEFIDKNTGRKSLVFCGQN